MNLSELSLIRKWDAIGAFSVVKEPIGLAYFRILLGLFLLCVDPPSWSWLAEIPDTLFHPTALNIANIFSGFPSAFWLETADITLVILLIGFTLGIGTRFCSLALFFLILIMNGFSYSLGKIDHDILFNLLFLTLAFSNAGTQMALIPGKPVSQKTQMNAFGFYGICIAFGLFSAGFPKSLMWIDFDLTTSGIFRWYYNGYYNLGRTHFLAPYFQHLSLGFTEIMDYIIPIFECLGFCLLLKSRKHWRLWLFMLGIFHLLNTLILNIPFTRHALVYGIFILPYIFEKHLPKSPKMILACIPFILIPAINQLVGRVYFHRPGYWEIDLSLTLSLAIWILFLVLSAPYIFRNFKFGQA